MATTGAGMTWADTQKYINYLPAVTLDKGQTVRLPRGDFVTGTVDMKGYLDWLNRNGYNIHMKVQCHADFPNHSIEETQIAHTHAAASMDCRMRQDGKG